MFENEKFQEILNVLRHGGVILYPTDTIWGLGCDATNAEAVDKISTIKERTPDKGYVLLVDSVEMLKKHVGIVHPRVETLLSYHVRPLTIIYDEAFGVASNVLAPDGSVGIRVTQDPFCRELIAQFGKPIVSTSANRSGAPFPAHFGEISSDVLEKVDLVVKYKQDVKERGEPSVIARFNREYEELDFLRE
ncbi:MAG: threonylcarbamoyl-AMP synthase [Saprospiraceae bacterium]|nr:threonylcarbamoyl-AMP synthase [Saprospiraceae bacterium]